MWIHPEAIRIGPEALLGHGRRTAKVDSKAMYGQGIAIRCCRGSRTDRRKKELIATGRSSMVR